MNDRSSSKDASSDETTLVCPNCALILKEKVECCPRCNARIAVDHDESLADKASADSFPASDPPSH